MATPYLQVRLEEVPSTQDIARSHFIDVPVVVIASSQTRGRGRSGAQWDTAPRALAVSMSFGRRDDDRRPFSLMAGVAACRSIGSRCRLEWPNDVVQDQKKVGGILVEESDGVVVAGLGLNLWWPDPPEGVSGLWEADPGPGRHAEVGGLWAAETMRLLDGEGWPIGEYRELCSTIGVEITWEPSGSGRAVDVGDDGALIVEDEGVRRSITSGAVRHVRSQKHSGS